MTIPTCCVYQRPPRDSWRDLRSLWPEAEDLEAFGKPMINMVSYMDWLLGTVTMLSCPGNRTCRTSFTCLLVLGWCLSHMMWNSVTLYANVILKRHNAVLNQFLKDMPFKDSRDLPNSPVSEVSELFPLELLRGVGVHTTESVKRSGLLNLPFQRPIKIIIEIQALKTDLTQKDGILGQFQGVTKAVCSTSKMDLWPSKKTSCGGKKF